MKKFKGWQDVYNATLSLGYVICMKTSAISFFLSAGLFQTKKMDI